jgi:hypothetical protein
VLRAYCQAAYRAAHVAHNAKLEDEQCRRYVLYTLAITSSAAGHSIDLGSQSLPLTVLSRVSLPIPKLNCRTLLRRHRQESN